MPQILKMNFTSLLFIGLSVAFFIFQYRCAGAVVIQAEDYVKGPNGEAYLDSDSENTGNFHPENEDGVDLWQELDGGPIRIGNTKKNEWVKYTYDFPATGRYTFTFYFATPNNDSRTNILINGELVKTISIKQTDSFVDFEPVSFDADVAKGAQTIKIVILASAFDFDKFTIEPLLFECVSYLATTNRKISLSWQEVDGADFYEIRLYNLEREANLLPPLRTDTNSITFPFPRAAPSGHFIVSLRACPNPSNARFNQCSAWVNTTDPEVGMVNGKKRGWWIYGYLAPPSQP
jgi:hypothetical protein